VNQILADAGFPVEVAIIALVTIIGIAGIVTILRRRTSRQPSGFKEIFGTQKGKEDYFAMTRPRDDLEKLSKRQIDKLVKEYVDSAGQSAAFWQVIHLGERAIPSLLKILADPTNQARPVGKDVTCFHKSKVERALEILSRHDLPEVVPHLIELASHEDSNLRYSTAFSLASYPSSSTLELISKLMVDPEEHVRSGIYIGLSHAIRENRLTPELRHSITGLLSEVVVKESEATFFVMHPASLLLDLDVNAAAKLLATPEVLNDSRPGSAKIIELLSQKGVPIPDPILRSLLAATGSADIDYRLADLRGELLKAMADMKHPEAESLILRTLASGPSIDGEPAKAKALINLKELAAEALCIVMGIRDPIDRVYDYLDEASKTGNNLEGPLLYALVVTELDMEISNGGFDQYFFNGSGDRAAIAVTALQEIGAMEHAEIARAAVSLFGAEGPSSDREKRFRQREAMDRKQMERLETLDNEWFAAEPIIRQRIHTYCAANADAFKKQAS
jgi:hypothetical protein